MSLAVKPSTPSPLGSGSRSARRSRARPPSIRTDRRRFDRSCSSWATRPGRRVNSCRSAAGQRPDRAQTLIDLGLLHPVPERLRVQAKITSALACRSPSSGPTQPRRPGTLRCTSMDAPLGTLPSWPDDQCRVSVKTGELHRMWTRSPSLQLFGHKSSLFRLFRFIANQPTLTLWWEYARSNLLQCLLE